MGSGGPNAGRRFQLTLGSIGSYWSAERGRDAAPVPIDVLKRRHV